MPAEFNPNVIIAILFLSVLALGGLILVAAHVIGPKRRGETKHGTYESGVDPISDARRRFNVRYYLVAVMFIVFDVEIIFLYPWATLFSQLTLPDPAYAAWSESVRAAGFGPGFFLVSIGLFFGLLTIGFLYEWRKGIFRWD